MFKTQHKEFTCQRDGLTIHGTMFKPRGKGPFKTIIVSHEFMMNRITTVRLAYRFASELGFAAFCYDFNGGGTISQSEGKTPDMSVVTEVADLKAVIEYVKAQPYTDNDDLNLMGCSQGGFVSALVAAELGVKEIKRLVLFYPALSIPDDARKGSMIMAKFDPKNIPEKLFCGPIILGKCYPEAVMDWDPFEMISKYNGPVLLVHGTKDHIVDYQYSVKAYDAYQKAHEDAVARGELKELPRLELETIENGEHLFPVPWHRIDAVNTVLEFLQDRTEIVRIDVKVIMSLMTLKLKDGVIDWAIPFKGKVSGRFLNGELREVFYDQRYYGLGVNDVCADYVARGKDYTGAENSIHIWNRNVGFFGWKPTVKAEEGGALDFINHTEAFAEMRMLIGRGVNGPLVRIFMDYDATK